MANVIKFSIDYIAKRRSKCNGEEGKRRVLSQVNQVVKGEREGVIQLSQYTKWRNIQERDQTVNEKEQRFEQEKIVDILNRWLYTIVV